MLLLGVAAVIVVAVAAVTLATRGGAKKTAGPLRVAVEGPHGLAPLGLDIAAALYGAGAVVRIDDRGRVVYRVPIGEHPTNPAAVGPGLWVPVIGAHRLVELEASSGKVLRRLSGTYAAAVAGPPGALFLPTWPHAPKRPKLWRGNAVTRLDTATGTIAWRRSFQGIVLTVAYGNGRVWVPDFAGNTMAVLNAKSGSTVTTKKLPGRPVAVAAGDRCTWVALSGGSLLRLDPRTGRIKSRISIDGENVDYMVAADGGVWLAPYAAPTAAALEHVSCRTGRVDSHRLVEGASQGLAVTGAAVWVADYGRNDVLRLQKRP